MALLLCLSTALTADLAYAAGVDATAATDLQTAAAPDLSRPPVPYSANDSAVALGIYRPSLPDDLSSLAVEERALTHPVSIVHWFALWGGWKSAFSRTDLDVVSAHGSLPMITWEPWAGVGADPSWSLKSAILSGRMDAYIASWAEGMAAYGKPVLLRFAHEMHNQPNYPWAVGVNGNTAADYVAAWRYVRGFFQRAGATNVLWVWNPNTLGDAPALSYSSVYQSLYPGDDEVDYVGLDIYNTGPALNWGAPYWRSFAAALSQPYAAITSVSSRPVILPEVSSGEVGGSKAAWIQAALTSGLNQFPKVRALVWFDVNKELPWNLGSSNSSLAAWLAVSGSQRFDVGPTVPS